MTDSALLALHRSIDELTEAVSRLTRMHGKTSVVARLSNDLERLKLDAVDAQALRTPDLHAVRGEGNDVYHVSDEPYDHSMWADSDQEGVGGYGKHP